MKLRGNEIITQDKVSVTTETSDPIVINGNVILHNAGNNIIYYSPYSDVSADSSELAVGEKSPMYHIRTLYVVGAGASTLKYEILT